MSTSHWLNNAKSEPKRNAIQRCKRETKAIRKAEGDERDILFFRPPQSKTPNPNFFTLLSPKIPHFLCSKPHLFSFLLPLLRLCLSSRIPWRPSLLSLLYALAASLEDPAASFDPLYLAPLLQLQLYQVSLSLNFCMNFYELWFRLECDVDFEVQRYHFFSGGIF